MKVNGKMEKKKEMELLNLILPTFLSLEILMNVNGKKGKKMEMVN